MNKNSVRMLSLLFLLIALPLPMYGQLAQFLTHGELTSYNTPYPPDIAGTTWRPIVTNGWHLSDPTKTIVSLRGHDTFGGSPWLLGSPTVTNSPSTRDYQSASGENWRVGYFNYNDTGNHLLGAFVALLPPDFSIASPASSIDRVVVWVGSGDNRARSTVTSFDLGSVSAPGTLFVSIDMRMISQGMDVPYSPGPTMIRKGVEFIYESLDLHTSVPLYVAGFSAGGAGAMSVAYELGEQLTGAVSIAPIAIPWNVFSNPQFITPAPATPINHWAAVFALDTISPPFYTTYYGGTITPLLQYIFQDGNTYNDTNPFNRLQHGSPLKTPLLILTGAGDELGAKEVGQQFTFSGGGRINTIPVVYGPADYTAGRIINFPAVVSMMESNDNITTVFLLSAGHTPVTPWGLDMRNLMLEFFYALENQ